MNWKTAKELMACPVVGLPMVVPASTAQDVLRYTRHNAFPVYGNDERDYDTGMGRLDGYMLRSQLQVRWRSPLAGWGGSGTVSGRGPGLGGLGGDIPCSRRSSGVGRLWGEPACGVGSLGVVAGRVPTTGKASKIKVHLRNNQCRMVFRACLCTM